VKKLSSILIVVGVGKFHNPLAVLATPRASGAASALLIGGLCYWRAAAFHQRDIEARRKLDTAAAG